MKKAIFALTALFAVSGLFAGEPDFGLPSYGDNFSGDAFWTALPLTFFDGDAVENSTGDTDTAPAVDRRAVRAQENKWLAVGLNLLPGFGLGSFIQGDWVSGIVGAGCNVIALSCIVIHYTVWGIATTVTLGMAGAEDPKTGLIPLAIGLLVVSRVYGVIAPFVYANKFSVSAGPALDSKGNLALGCSMSFRF